MSVPNLSDIETQPPIRFPKGNKITFWMDFSGWHGVPSDRNFYILGQVPNHDAWDLVARGYGVAGEYGNGSIMVKKSDMAVIAREAVSAFTPPDGKPQESRP